MHVILAVSNVKRIVEEYGLYFITLVLSGAMLYIFNSLPHQPAVAMLTNEQWRLASMMILVLSYSSLFLSITMALWMVYANHTFIHKRKQEIGTYMLLGIEQSS